jgi:hypothetical protein
MGEKVIMPEEYATNAYMHLLVQATEKRERNRCLLGIPVTGLVRIEWVLGRYGQMIPCNWSHADHLYPLSQTTPLGYNVMDARNVIVHQAVTEGFAWLFFNDHDTILPVHTFMALSAYMRQGDYPVVSGLYFTKSEPAEPLVYRGRGNSYYADWKMGDKIWVDGCGCGCLLLNVKLLTEMWKDAPEYLAGGNQKVRKVFDTPQFQWLDPEAGSLQSFQGTEDLAFFDRMMEGDYLAKAGFKKVAKKKYPIYLDTTIFCRHITPDGIQYPLQLRW